MVLVGIGLHKVTPEQPFLSAAGLGEPSLSLLKLKFTSSGKEFYFSVACLTKVEWRLKSTTKTKHNRAALTKKIEEDKLQQERINDFSHLCD